MRIQTKAYILAELLKKRTCVKCGRTDSVKKFPMMSCGTRDRTCRKCRIARVV